MRDGCEVQRVAMKNAVVKPFAPEECQFIRRRLISNQAGNPFSVSVSKLFFLIAFVACGLVLKAVLPVCVKSLSFQPGCSLHLLAVMDRTGSIFRFFLSLFPLFVVRLDGPKDQISKVEVANVKM